MSLLRFGASKIASLVTKGSRAPKGAPRVTPKPSKTVTATTSPSRTTQVTPSATTRPTVRPSSTTRSTSRPSSTTRSTPVTGSTRSKYIDEDQIARDNARLARAEESRAALAQARVSTGTAGRPAVASTRPPLTAQATRRLTQADVKKGLVTPEELAQDRMYRKAIADAKKASTATTGGGGAKPPSKPRTKKTPETPETPEPTPAKVDTGRRFRPTRRGTLETVGGIAPFVVPEDAPAPLRFAAAALGAGAGLSGLGRLAGRTGFLSQATRQAFGAAKPLSKAGMVLTRGVLPAATVAAGVEGVRRMTGGAAAQPAAAETPETMPESQVLEPSEMFPETLPAEEGGASPEQQYLDEVRNAIDLLTQEADAQAQADTAAVESAADSALQDLIEMYQGLGNVQAAAAAGDPILLQQLAAIDADYQSGMSQIANNYDAAISQVEGYQTQANELLTNIAAAQQTAFEQAAGGLEAGGIPTGLTPGEAAMSGVSDTALGGAGITGAALARGFAGAAQAGALADQLRAGTELGGELAAGRMARADVEAALGRDYLGAKADARTAAAEREAEARAEREQLAREGLLTAAQLRYERELEKEAKAARAAEAKADRRQRVAEIEAETRLAMADMVSQMTPEELARWKGTAAGKRTFKAPSWYGQYLDKPSDTPVKIQLAELPATVGSVNSVLDLVYGHMNTAEARNPATAQASWSAFFEEMSSDSKKILASRKIPTTGGQMYQELFKSTPSK